MARVTLVKLGGGLIAPKDWKDETVDVKTLKRLATEIYEAQMPDRQMIVVSGSGNFGHHAVKKYGIADEKGVRRVRISAEKIGQKVTLALDDAGVAAKLYISHKVIRNNDVSFEGDLRNSKVPVFYGDVVGDKNEGWRIYSGEMIIERLIGILKVKGWEIDVVQVSLMEGVLDSNGEVISEINARNWALMKHLVAGAIGVDVTGGMLHKVEESLKIADMFGVSTRIIGGTMPGRLKMILHGETGAGTIIKA